MFTTQLQSDLLLFTSQSCISSERLAPLQDTFLLLKVGNYFKCRQMSQNVTVLALLKKKAVIVNIVGAKFDFSTDFVSHF